MLGQSRARMPPVGKGPAVEVAEDIDEILEDLVGLETGVIFELVVKLEDVVLDCVSLSTN
jgi:hypothetical protein